MIDMQAQPDADMNLIKQSHGQSYVVDDVPIFMAEGKPPKFVHLFFFFFTFGL